MNTQENNLFDSLKDSICLTRLRKWLSVTFNRATDKAQTSKYYDVGYATALYDCMEELEKIYEEINRELIYSGKINGLNWDTTKGEK